MNGGFVMGREGGAGQAGEVRQAVERQVDLHRDAFDFERANRGEEIRGQFACFQELQESDLGIGVRGHHAGANLLSTGQRHTGRAAVLGEDFRHARAGANLHAHGARRRRHRLGDAAHASAHESPQAAFAAHAAHDMMEQHVGRAGRVRAALGADHAVGGQRHLQGLRLKPRVEKILHALREDVQVAHQFFRGHLHHAAAQAGELLPVGESAPRDVRWSLKQQRFDEARQAVDILFVVRVALGVARGELADLLAGLRRCRTP